MRKSKSVKLEEVVNNDNDNDTRQRETPQQLLTAMCNQYMTALKETAVPRQEFDKKNEVPELEVKFGTKGYKQLTKMDYDNVIKKLISEGYTCDNTDGFYSLRIIPDILDIRTGEVKPTNIRVEVNGLNSVQEYCRTNDILKLVENIHFPVNFLEKRPVKVEGAKYPLKPVEFKDFNMRVSYVNEIKHNSQGKAVMELFDNWSKSKKIFRFINRVTYYKPGGLFKFDLSIVRTSTKKDRQLIKTYNIGDSNVFENPEIFEMEIEAHNLFVKTHFNNLETAGADLSKEILSASKIVLCGLQKTNYPVSYSEQNTVLQDYMKMLYKEEYNPEKRIYPSNFIGPSSKTLQIKNVVKNSDNTNIPNIRKDFCVTDKADGDRHLLYVNGVGRLYLINTNMEVIFTGARTEEQQCFNSLIDGELILHDKLSQVLNTFAAFDIYYIKDVDVRALGFMPTERTDDYTKFRLPLLKQYVKALNPIGITVTHSVNKSSPINIETKRFYPFYNIQEARAANAKPDMDIFDACNYILSNIKDGLYKYTTDGLIFTHMKYGVGANAVRVAGPLKKTSWEYSFKWKPAEYNTVDFLVSTKKGPNGDEIITSIFEEGINTAVNKQLTQYKTLILMCGFDETRHGYINPCADVLEDRLPDVNPNNIKADTYVPKRFVPTTPFDPNAGLCNVLLKTDITGKPQMFTEENEVFTDGTIVEFKYEMEKEGLFKWVPLRVRYDKTFELKQGLKNYGNAYNVANDNWFSIHNPITEEMITTGDNIPEVVADEDIYYSQTAKTSDTKALRDFHNLFVKNLIIRNVSKRGDTLIDFACGKGGDLSKWINANLSFVFGIDISKDNLENRFNGACTRFLNHRREYKDMPYALFVNGDSSLNIRSGQAMMNEKAIQITKAVFGQGVKDPNLGAGVVRQFGKGENGFNVTSIQFAIHYMFESPKTFHNLMRNVAECTKLGGHFIGTSYDGKTVFNILKKKKVGQGISTYNEGRKVWEIIREYDSDIFEDEESSLGYKISVFQESIGQQLTEYLVNYDYLTRIMEDYGFVLLTREEAKQIGIPNGTGMFSELFNKLSQEIIRDPSKGLEYGDAPLMKDYEQQISFLNRYFIYKKIRTVNAEKIANNFLAKLPLETLDDKIGTLRTKEIVKIETTKDKAETKVKKLDRKMLLVAATEATDEPVPSSKKATISKKATAPILIEEEEPAPVPVPVPVPTKVSKKVSKKPTTIILEEEE